MSEERDSLFDKIQNRIMPVTMTKAYGTKVITLNVLPSKYRVKSYNNNL